MVTYDTPALHICSMCIKTNQVGKQEVEMWRVQKRFPRYGVHIWSLWLNIRFMPSIVAEKNATTNILGWTEGQTDGRTGRSKTIYPPPAKNRKIKSKYIQWLTKHNTEIGDWAIWTHQEPGCEFSCYGICAIKSILYRPVIIRSTYILDVN